MPGFDPSAAWLAQSAGWRSSAAAHWTARGEAAQPIRVRAWLGAPVAWDGYTPVCLEGALQYAVIVLEARQAPDEAYAGIGAGWCPPPIPIAETTVVDDEGRPWRIARCSVAQPAPLAHETKRIRRKRTRADALSGDAIVNTAGGWPKALNIPIPTLTTPWLDFYAMADVERLRALLADTPGLARDAKRGLGTVVGWEVDIIEADWSIRRNAVLMRVLPRCGAGELDVANFDPCTYDVRESGTYAPYWHKASRTTCIVPRLSGASS